MRSPFLIFLLKFLGIFCLLYFGTIAVIGLAAPGKYYSPFIEQHLDYISAIKRSIVNASRILLSMFGIETISLPGFIIRYPIGRGVFIAMNCVGYGVYSFWIAYVAANKGKILAKLCWIVGGVLLLWLINVIRISLYLVALNKSWPMPLGLDHHTWFNIFAYLAIFGMIWIFEKQLRKNSLRESDRPQHIR